MKSINEKTELPTAEQIIALIKQSKNDKYAVHHQKFFKTEKGGYGEGDLFYGLKIPEQRRIAKESGSLPLTGIEKLLHNPYHECRMTALIILIEYFQKGDNADKEAAVNLYLDSTEYINNWDLVDITCYKLLGPWLEKRDRSLLYKLADSHSLWEQRISIITTMHFIRRGDFDDCLAISEKLLNHPHDLIHKAVGWMLREVGKRNKSNEDEFLKKHYKTMPRIMLRYAIEKYPETERQAYLKNQI